MNKLFIVGTLRNTPQLQERTVMGTKTESCDLIVETKRGPLAELWKFQAISFTARIACTLKAGMKVEIDGHATKRKGRLGEDDPAYFFADRIEEFVEGDGPEAT